MPSTPPRPSSAVSLRRPLRSLLLIFFVWKLVLLLIALCSPGPGYDTSTRIDFGWAEPHTLKERLVEKLTRWDALYFVRLAERGYVFEQEWAFGFGFSRSLGIVGRALHAVFGADFVDSKFSDLAVAGIACAHLSHLTAVLTLYKLTVLVFSSQPQSQDLAFVTSVLHILSPAGLFLSAPYAEAPFAALQFLGLWFYVVGIRDATKLRGGISTVTAGAFFGISTTFRSNGLLSGALFADQLIRVLGDWLSSPSLTGSLRLIRRSCAPGVAGILVLAGLVGPQYIAWTEYCVIKGDRRGWCERGVPSIYQWVQQQYWDVGLFRYWTLSNIPLFVLAFPMLSILIYSAFDTVQGSPSLVQPMDGTRERKTVFTQNLPIKLAIPVAIMADTHQSPAASNIDLNVQTGNPSSFPDGLVSTDQNNVGLDDPMRDIEPNLPSLNLAMDSELLELGVQDGKCPRFTSYRRRPRTYPYATTLPYNVEDEELRLCNLLDIIKNLFISIKAGDYTPGAIYWTRELKSWLSLKFDPPIILRSRLAKVYYHLALAPGIDNTAADRFAGMFMTLLKKKSYLRPQEDLVLDWRPITKALQAYCLPKEAGLVHSTIVRRNVRTLTKMASFAHHYFESAAIPDMLDKYLPYFSASTTEGGFVVIGLFNVLLPSQPPPEGASTDLYPQHYLPTLFHLWSLINRSKQLDINFIDLYSRLARDALPAKHIPFSEWGIFSKDQSSLIFTAILRLLEIPVGQSSSVYSATVDVGAGLALVLDRDNKKHPTTHHIARWIVMSLSPECLDKEDSVLSRLEGLIEAVETFFHPSNAGGWTKNLSQLVYYLTDFFVMRWNKEHRGESKAPDERKLNDELRRRFVLCLREVIFMGIYAKSGTAMTFSLSTLQNLAYLEPSLILPGALQRIYPSIQGLVEVHRTTSSLRSLQILSNIMVRQKGFRCHITTLLGLALPGIDANDLEKTLHTLSYIQATCYNIPFHDLTQGHEGVQGSTLAINWITSEVERMEREGAGIEIDYETELSDEDEAMVLRSSTTGFSEFLSSFLGRVFTLLENLPDAARVRGGSAEETVQNTLPACFTPLLACLSDELYDGALNKIADFITGHVVHQARDAAAFIINSLCKVNPKKALARLVPTFVQAIRYEIDENGAASTRNTGFDVLPRDRALVWNVSMLSMCVVHVGDAVLDHRDALFDVAVHMLKQCKGIPTTHISNFVHHLLLNLTAIYPVDYALYEPEVLARGLDVGDWGKMPRPNEIKPKWHLPSEEEQEFAINLFETLTDLALQDLKMLIRDSRSVGIDPASKEWSDELTRNLVLLRLIVSGMSYLFDWDQVSQILKSGDDSGSPSILSASSAMEVDQPTGDYISQIVENHHNIAATADSDTDSYSMVSMPSSSSNADIHIDCTVKKRSFIANVSDDEAALGGDEELETRSYYHYPTGYVLKTTSESYQKIHTVRENVGWCFHNVHAHLIKKHEDDVGCFTALYSAFRTWFIDIGIERSAHTLDRVTRLLTADIHPYKMSGLRKEYPRPLLVRRGLVYHLERLRHNATPRKMTQLDKFLMRDLAESALSPYTDIRKNAQYAGESAMKVLIGAKPLVIPFFLDTLEQSIARNDHPRMKGAIFSLLFGSLAKTIERDWRYAPRLIRAYVDLANSDRPSIQKAAAGASFIVMDYGRPAERRVLLNDSIINLLDICKIQSSEGLPIELKTFESRMTRKRETIEAQKAKLANELVETTKQSHWRKATRAATLVVALGLRFQTVASTNMMELITKGAIDDHPGLRGLFSGALVAIFSLIEMRVSCSHSYENYLLNRQKIPHKIKLPAHSGQEGWTNKFLDRFANEKAEYYVDHDHSGWLTWKDTYPAYSASPKSGIDYDDLERSALSCIGKIMTLQWFAKFFDYLKQEPRDSSADRFRMASAMLLLYAFEVVLEGLAPTTFEDIKGEVKRIFDDGTDKHQHRATAEILGALLATVADKPVGVRTQVWDFAFPIVKDIFSDGLTPENSGYWATFLHLVLQGKDPRRSWPLVKFLSDFRLDMNSNAAFKESSRMQLLQQCIVDNGWHFQLHESILADFLAHINHPYKGVREAMGQNIAAIYRYRYHESFPNTAALIKAQSEDSSIGIQPYRPSAGFSTAIMDTFNRLEQWRLERTPGQQSPSSYTMGCKTVLLWLESTLSSHECTSLVSFFPDLFMQQTLHMMDVKEDQELMSLAYHVFRALPNIPHTRAQDAAFIDALIRIGTTSPLWHQRLRILINIQTFYFRRLFLISETQKKSLLTCVADILQDTQVEVRMGASTTLSGMIRCSPISLRSSIVQSLKTTFTALLASNPLPRRNRGVSTPTPDHARVTIKRHSAVLGLGALVNAFPYMSPPPLWLPDILTTLAVRASADPGIVGKSAKGILSDFKKTRQDTWHVDKKVFTPEQLEELDGVLWKPYFA
ncbi:MAG: hypothetical protein M1814_002918 [Vezdaea aestivalis]|nr:MAG: hypothetical protein M1814_002918 [Vezdaea aestivalis]